MLGRNLLLAVLVALGTTMAGCSDDATDDTPSSPQDLTVETFNLGLAGAFIPYEQQRRDPIAQAIASSSADIICLQEVWRQSDKELIAAAAQNTFPHHAYFQHDLNTVVDDPTDQNGETPAAPTSAPCTGEQAEKLNAVLDCLKEECSTVPGSEDGHTTSANCAEKQCAVEAIALLLGSAADKQCYACASTSLPTASIGEIRSQCTTDPKAGLAFNGQSGVMILSKTPLENVEDYVLPGTWNRRAVAMATAVLENGARVDVYCNHLSPVFSGALYPYTGQYGNGKTNGEGWAAEQLLQAHKLVGLVQSRTGAGKALIMGDFNASRAYAEGILAEAEPTLDALEEVFVHAVAADYQPVCTHCKDNPINDEDTDSVWIDHIYMSGIAASDVLSTSRVYQDNVVQVTDDTGASLSIPLSDHYGVRSVIRITP